MTAITPSHGGTSPSPSSSPRLPSPPPFTEVQFGPKSPTINLESGHQLGDATRIDHGASRRIRPGTKAADMAAGPALVPLAQLDSPFALQEHLKALYHSYTKDPKTGNTIPINKQSAMKLATPPQTSETGETVDKNLWLYELCRFLTVMANNLIIAFFKENPPCSSATCPEMRASEWQYLCAVHDPPKSCCAIDYCCHTLDWATNILTSPKLFPSRMVLGGDNGNVAAAMRQMTNIFRRVYRIFAHAWFQHREVFWTVEGHYGLYVCFKTVCDIYQLIPDDNYTVPPEAEGQREEEQETPVSLLSPDPRNMMKILQKPGEDEVIEEVQQPANSEVTTTISTGATTRRHKHTPSTGSHVNTIVEGIEEEESESNAKPSTVVRPQSSTIKEPSLDQKGTTDPVSITKTLDISSAEQEWTGAREPEDPTPTGNDDDIDPMDVATQVKEEEEEKTPDTMSEEQKQKIQEHHGTLEHLEKFEDTPAEASDTETTILSDEKDKDKQNEKVEEVKEDKSPEYAVAGTAQEVDAVDYAMSREKEDKKEAHEIPAGVV